MKAQTENTPIEYRDVLFNNYVNSFKDILIAGTVILDDKFIIKEADAGAEILLKRNRDKLINAAVSQFIPQLHSLESSMSDKPVEWQVQLDPASGQWIKGTIRSTASYESAKIYVLTIQDISAQKKQEILLKEKVSEVNNLYADLDNFLYKASHDLKSPISNIEGLLNCLIDELSEEKKQEPGVSYIVTLIQDSIKKYRATVGNLAIAARIEKTDSGASLIDLRELYNEVELFLQKTIADAGARIDADFSPIPEITFSRKNFRSILMQLITNCIKFRDDKRTLTIEISAARTGKYFLLAVKDNGIGMTQEEQQNIVKQMSNEEEQLNIKGIGLSIIKQVLNKSNGYLEVDSQPGQGSTFRIFLPLQEVSISL